MQIFSSNIGSAVPLAFLSSEIIHMFYFQATFKKVKKKVRKIRKKPKAVKADDLLPFDGTSGVGPRERNL